MVRYELDTATRLLSKFGSPTKNTPGTGMIYPTEHIFGPFDNVFFCIRLLGLIQP